MFPGVVFTSQWDQEQIRFIRDMDVRTSYVQRMPLALKKHYLYAPMLPRVYKNFQMKEFDVILSDSHSFAHGVTKRADALHICYYHTPARALWVPEIDGRANSGKLAFLRRMIARRLRRLDLVASRNPDVIFANSQTTADRLKKFYGRDVAKVIYPPVHVEKWLEVPRKSDRLGLMYWGRLIPYKRVDLAIEAAKITGEPLQIVGSGPSEKELKDLAAGHRNITFHGRLPDAELMTIMSESRAFLFPAYEDFGIVAVEAMAAGLPVVAYGVGGATETVLPDYGVLFPEQTVQSVVQAIGQLNGRIFKTFEMREHAKKFHVDKFRKRYREAVETAIVDHFAKGLDE